MSTLAPITALRIPFLSRRVRAYFAPVDRLTGTPTIFDPAVNSTFELDTPAAPWTDLGWIDGFVRQSESKILPLNAGLPATVQYQVRDSLAATVTFRFKTWSKLSMALASGSQHMNILAAVGGGNAIGSGAKALTAVSLGAGSTASMLAGVYGSGILPGSMVAVDSDYAEQTGFVGAGISAAYVRRSTDVGNDPDHVRRVSFNVGRVVQVTPSGLQMAEPLPAGMPASGMKLQQIRGFVDREGGSFFQEWSALFVMPGEQGDRLLLHYPRLQAMEGVKEAVAPVAAPLESVLQAAAFRALPVIDVNDGEQVLVFAPIFLQQRPSSDSSRGDELCSSPSTTMMGWDFETTQVACCPLRIS